MPEREITEGMIETTLRKGVRFFDPKHGTIAHVLRVDSRAGSR